MADNGVQDKENKEEVHFPQTWEEVVNEVPLTGDFPKMKDASAFTFGEACRFNVIRVELMGTYVKQESGKSSSGVDVVTNAVQSVMERNTALEHALEFYKSIADDPDGFDSVLTGVNPDVLYLSLIEVTWFYANALGKSTESKASSTGTKQS